MGWLFLSLSLAEQIIKTIFRAHEQKLNLDENGNLCLCEGIFFFSCDCVGGEAKMLLHLNIIGFFFHFFAHNSRDAFANDLIYLMLMWREFYLKIERILGILKSF